MAIRVIYYVPLGHIQIETTILCVYVWRKTQNRVTWNHGLTAEKNDDDKS